MLEMVQTDKAYHGFCLQAVELMVFAVPVQSSEDRTYQHMVC